MTGRVALATCTGRRDAPAADAPLMRALENAGANPARYAWNEPGVPWGAFAACVVRTTWDWHKDPDAFTAWLKRTDQEALLLNPLKLQLWGLDKSYLPELGGQGVSIIPTIVLKRPDAAAALAFAKAQKAERLVIKPALSAGSLGVQLVPAQAEDLQRCWDSYWPAHGAVLVQPYLSNIETEGEISIVLLEGAFSHAVRKQPQPGDFRVQLRYGGTYSPAEAAPEDLALARACLALMPAAPLYARIDIVRDAAGKPQVMECEVVEPDLYFAQGPGSAERMAAAILKAIQA